MTKNNKTNFSDTKNLAKYIAKFRKHKYIEK